MLTELIKAYSNFFNDSLIGIYLHGSLAMECFDSNSSDINLLVTLQEPMTQSQKENLANLTKELGGPADTITLTVLLEKHDLMNSDKIIPQFHYDKGDQTASMNDDHIIVFILNVKECGKTLFGPPISDKLVFSKERCINSMMTYIEQAEEQITQDPPHLILSYCRLLHFLKLDCLVSKKEVGKWAKSVIPCQYHRLIDEAVAFYSGTQSFIEWNVKELYDLAGYMQEEIISTYQIKMNNLGLEPIITLE